MANPLVFALIYVGWVVIGCSVVLVLAEWRLQLGLLASLPLVGRWMPKREDWSQKNRVVFDENKFFQHPDKIVPGSPDAWTPDDVRKYLAWLKTEWDRYNALWPPYVKGGRAWQ